MHRVRKDKLLLLSFFFQISDIPFIEVSHIDKQINKLRYAIRSETSIQTYHSERII